MQNQRNTMKNNSLLAAVFIFLFSIAGYFTHLFAIFQQSFISIALLGFFYVTPLFIEAIEDVSHVVASSKTQYVIDKIAAVCGGIYLTFLLVLVIVKGHGISIGEDLDFLDLGLIPLGKTIALILPVSFVLKKLYSLRNLWVQSSNTAAGYFDQIAAIEAQSKAEKI